MIRVDVKVRLDCIPDRKVFDQKMYAECVVDWLQDLITGYDDIEDVKVKLEEYSCDYQHGEVKN